MIANNDHNLSAEEYRKQGIILKESRQFEEALKNFQEALKINRKLKKLHNVAIDLKEIADCYKNLRQYNEAEHAYSVSISILEKEGCGESIDMAILLNKLAICYENSGCYKKAEPLYLRALEIDEKVYGPNHPEVAIDLSYLASLNETTGRYKEAEPLYLRALEIGEKIYGSNHPDVAIRLNNLAILYTITGRYNEAEPLHVRALEITEKVYGPHHPDVAIRLNNLGILYEKTGFYDEAEPMYVRALEITEKVYGPHHPDVAIQLSNLASLYKTIGRYAEADLMYLRALEITEKVYGPNHPNVAMRLNNLAILHTVTGLYAKAEPMFVRAVEITEKVHGSSHPDLASRLSNLALLYENTGRYAEAEPMYVRALEITEKVHGPNHPDVAIWLSNLALLYENTGRYAEAEPMYVRALEITEKVHGPHHPSMAIRLNSLASLYMTIGHYAEAEQLSRRALSVAEYSGNPKLLSDVQYGFSQLYFRIDQHNAAILFGKQAVNTIQNIRANISNLGKDVLQAHQTTVEGVFKHLAGLLIDEDRFAEAEQVLNLLKEQEYFEYIRRDAGYADQLQKVSFTATEASCDRMYQECAANLAILIREISMIQSKEHRTVQGKERLSVLEKEMEIASGAFYRTLDRIKESLPKKRGGVQQVEEAPGLMQALSELGNGAVAIYTLTTNDSFNLFLITSKYYKAFKISIGEKKLRKMIFDFRQALIPQKSLSNDALKYLKKKAKDLYEIIIQPVERELKELKAETIMWSLEGPLRYLPLSALHDGDQYLVETYQNVMITPACNIYLKDDPKAIWQGFGLGVTKAHENFSPLPEVEKELKSIIRSQDNPEAIFNGSLKLDEDFDWESMKQGLQKKYPLVHIASHFHCAPGNDTTSFLLLGDGQHLTIDKMKHQANLFGGVDLLTLSACDTAVGNVGQDGKEIESFGVIAQRQGAKAVVATLWPVADISTGLLMKEFYMRRAEGKTKASALQEAQIALLKGHIKKGNDTSADGTINFKQTGIDEQAPFAHPFFWAPFILIGNWK